jgi:hypothetical protein
MSERVYLDFKKTALTTVSAFFAVLLGWAGTKNYDALFFDSLTVYGLLLFFLLATYLIEIRLSMSLSRRFRRRVVNA